MKELDGSDVLLRSGEVARILGVSPSTVRNMALDGRLKVGYRTKSGQRKYYRKVVMELKNIVQSQSNECERAGMCVEETTEACEERNCFDLPPSTVNKFLTALEVEKDG